MIEFQNLFTSKKVILIYIVHIRVHHSVLIRFLKMILNVIYLQPLSDNKHRRIRCRSFTEKPRQNFY